MSSTETGKSAEQAVANELVKRKHTIIAMNWRTRWCEIDIISRHNKTVYFTEVKFRSESKWGGGLEYITDRKLDQMKFAAEFWMHENAWKGQVQLLGAEVSRDFVITIVPITD